MPFTILYAAKKEDALAVARFVLENFPEVDVALPLTQVAAEYGVTERMMSFYKAAGKTTAVKFPEQIGRLCLYSARSLKQIRAREK